MRRLTSVLTTAAITVTLPVHATGVAAATHQVGPDSTVATCLPWSLLWLRPTSESLISGLTFRADKRP